MSKVLGVDVGGTYTDLFLIDTQTGESSVAKVPSTRGREADGFLAGIEPEKLVPGIQIACAPLDSPVVAIGF